MSHEDQARKVEADLAAIIRARFKTRGGVEKEDAARLMWVRAMDGTSWGNWDPDDELQKLANLRDLVRKMDETWRDMHPFAQLELRGLLRQHASPENVKSDRDVVRFLDRGSRLLDSVAAEANQVLAAGQPPGKNTNSAAVLMVDEIRRIWRKRTGSPAPISTTSREFHGLVEEIFDALRPLGFKGKPVPAVRAWRRSMHRIDQ